VKNGLDLCAKNDLEANHLFVFSQEGELLRKIPSLMYSTGIGDLNGDGTIEAFGVVCHRDGGRRAREMSHLRCVNLATGEVVWEVPVPRVGLPGANALAADLNNDGKLEAIICDGNPVFYGHLPGLDWGAVYVVSHDGQLLQTIELPTWARRLIMCDIDDDGKNELIVQTDGKPAALHVFETDAPATTATWHLPFGNTHHWGAEHLPRK
ncbi:MAG: VCBS repeat-containing protein, partial [bacterium]|nr:VCBS repeat-containing protein [bacterium]